MKNASLFNIINWNKLQDSQLIHAGFSNSDRISYIHFDDGIIIKDMQFSSSSNFHHFFDGFYRFCADKQLEFIQYMVRKNDEKFVWLADSNWDSYPLDDETDDGMTFMIYEISSMKKLYFYRYKSEKHTNQKHNIVEGSDKTDNLLDKKSGSFGSLRSE